MAPPYAVTNGSNTVNKEKKLVSVLVTGFTPFRASHPVNPSYEIARLLPQLLPGSAADSPLVQVIAYGSPIRVCYKDVRELLPALLESCNNAIDMVLHIGMASCQHPYTVERYGHRGGYTKNRDLDGQIPLPEEAEGLFGDCPPRMETSLDFEDVVRRWQSSILRMPENSPAYKADCRTSENAGYFLCDYTYFNSLAWYGKRHQQFEGGEAADRPVLFLHVPAESDEVTLNRGREVTISLLRAMANSYVGAR